MSAVEKRYFYQVEVEQGVSALSTMRTGGWLSAFNALGAVGQIHDKNRLLWRGRLVSLKVYGCNSNTGIADSEPVINWTREGDGAQALRDLRLAHTNNKTETPAPVPQSRYVAPKAVRFDPWTYGTYMSRPVQRTFPVVKFNEPRGVIPHDDTA